MKVTNPTSIQLLDWIAEDWYDVYGRSSKKMTRKKACIIFKIALKMNKKKPRRNAGVFYEVDIKALDPARHNY